MKTIRKPHRLANIKIDLREWELGDWDGDVGDTVKVERFGNEITIEFDRKLFEQVARKIATEAIETFLTQDTTYVHAIRDGIEIEEEDGSNRFVIPWNHIYIKDGIPCFDFIRKWMAKELSVMEPFNEEVVEEYRKLGIDPPTEEEQDRKESDA